MSVFRGIAILVQSLLHNRVELTTENVALRPQPANPWQESKTPRQRKRDRTLGTPKSRIKGSRNTAQAGYAVETLSTEDGSVRLRTALARLQSGEPCRHDSPAFGPMNHQDRILFNLRHAELHLGFLQPRRASKPT